MAKLILSKKTMRSDGTAAIAISIGSGRNMIFLTGIYARPEDWDAAAQLYKGVNQRQVNLMLQTELNRIEGMLLELKARGVDKGMTNAELRAYLKAERIKEKPKKPKGTTVGDFFDRVAGSKSGRTRQIYFDTLTKLKCFCDPYSLSFDDLTKLWLGEFYSHMSGLAANTKSIHMRNLRAVVNAAIDEGVTNNYPFRRFRIPSGAVRKKALDVDILRRISEAEVEPWAVKYRDMFMLIFYLRGINIIDLCHLIAIEDGYIEYVRAKTHKPYSVKVEPEALSIIEKYRGSDYLLNIMETHSTYRTFYNQMRRGLEVIRQQLGISELTTYWARHSWATIAASLDIPKETIAAGLGHGGNSVTDIYIDFDQRKVDEANRRVIDWLLYNKK